jgi:predicted transcriptional regulator
MFLGDARQKRANGAAMQQAIMQYVQWRAMIGKPVKAGEKAA